MPSWFLPHLFEWLLVLFQPMEDPRLHALLERIGMPAGNGTLIVLYLLSLFLASVVIRRALAAGRAAVVDLDFTPVAFLALGFVMTGVVMLVNITQRAQLFADPDEYMMLQGYLMPSFHAVHRAIMPFDIAGIQEMLLPGNFQNKVQVAFMFWQEDSRGLFVYPALAILSLAPFLRIYTGPAVTGALLAMSVLPLIVGGFAFSIPVGLGYCLLLFLFCGGSSALRSLISRRA